eukprot:GHVS01064658.1.p1 GENE.GHVS01064658.1~~GHVS01064658.1.p1  ORF type:complete len:429 (-),score=24.50 GHVS01064658.1:187-1473(-)
MVLEVASKGAASIALLSRLPASVQSVTGLELDTLQDISFYLEPLDILSESTQSSASDLIRRNHMTVRNLSNIMWMEHQAWHLPRVEQQALLRPLFIVSLEPLGALMLQTLLARVDGVRTPLMFEMIYPFGIDGSQSFLGAAAGKSEDRRLQDTQFVLDCQREMCSDFPLMDILSAETPCDDTMIFEHCGRSCSFSYQCDAPKYLQWLTQNESAALRQAYPFHKRYLQHLQWKAGHNRRWVINATSSHLLTLESLFQTYPDAQIAIIHRDPMEVIPARCEWAQMAGGGRWPEDVKGQHAKRELGAALLMTEKLLNFRARNRNLSSRIVDVQFHELIRDPVKVVRSLATAFDLKVSAENATAMRQAWQAEKTKHRDLIRTAPLSAYQLAEADVRLSMASYYTSGYMKLPSVMMKMMIASRKQGRSRPINK